MSRFAYLRSALLHQMMGGREPAIIVAHGIAQSRMPMARTVTTASSATSVSPAAKSA
jgi:hypothetical protein